MREGFAGAQHVHVPCGIVEQERILQCPVHNTRIGIAHRDFVDLDTWGDPINRGDSMVIGHGQHGWDSICANVRRPTTDRARSDVPMGDEFAYAYMRERGCEIFLGYDEKISNLHPPSSQRQMTYRRTRTSRHTSRAMQVPLRNTRDTATRSINALVPLLIPPQSRSPAPRSPPVSRRRDHRRHRGRRPRPPPAARAGRAPRPVGRARAKTSGAR